MPLILFFPLVFSKIRLYHDASLTKPLCKISYNKTSNGVTTAGDYIVSLSLVLPQTPHYYHCLCHHFQNQTKLLQPFLRFRINYIIIHKQLQLLLNQVVSRETFPQWPFPSLSVFILSIYPLYLIIGMGLDGQRETVTHGFVRFHYLKSRTLI